MRNKAKKRRRRKRLMNPAGVGAAPGTLVPEPDALSSGNIQVIFYGPDGVQESEVGVEQLPKVEVGRVLWINLDGLGDVEVIRRIGEHFSLHALALEDVMHVGQRPKVEDYEDHLYMAIRTVVPGERLDTEQISLFVGNGFVVTFQEKPGDCFGMVRERIRRGKGRIRTQGADYLAYALLDAVVDHFAPVVDRYGEQLETLEDGLLRGVERNVIARLLDIRVDLQILRRILAPLSDKLVKLQADTLELISDDTRVYLRDCHDHVLRLLDAVESWRDFGSSLMEVYLAMSGQQLNEVMKVLTIIATIFIPLSFIAGLYGMNFKGELSPYNMPELDWYLGYPFALSLMAVVAALLLVYFYRRGWLSSSD